MINPKIKLLRDELASYKQKIIKDILSSGTGDAPADTTLEIEYEKIQNKTSKLSKIQRDLVVYFIKETEETEKALNDAEHNSPGGEDVPTVSV